MTESETQDKSWELAGDAILKSYAVVFFSQKRWLGAVALVSTLWVPQQGLIGLTGLLISLLAALLLGLERSYIRSGAYLFNSLLISLALGYFLRVQLLDVSSLFVLLPIFSVLTLLMTVSLSDILYRSLGAPPISIPFVITQLLLLVLLIHQSSQPIVLTGTDTWSLGTISLKQHVLTFVRSFSAILFVPQAEVGLILLGAILLTSRLLVLYGILGYLVGMSVLPLLPQAISYDQASLLTFNYVFCAMSLGGILFIPSRGSLVLAIMGTVICATTSVVLLKMFSGVGFAPIALPFNLVVLLVLHAMKLRTVTSSIHATPFWPTSPEENFRRFHLLAARFPDFGYPSIQCPFSGERVVTQGVNGKTTHLREWQHALDFEVLDRPGQRRAGSSNDLKDFYTFDTPVLAPENGTVVKTIDHIEDGLAGSSNLANNWGNLVIIRLDSGLYVTLCHLRNKSIKTHEGKRVRTGETIGYCGNSGRSPVPHLHVQLQNSAQVGAATVPFRLRHYFERNGRAVTYHSAGVPDEGARVQAAATDPGLAECFRDIARRDYHFVQTYRNREVRETVTCRINSLGQYVFRSDRGAELTASVQDHVFHMYDYAGGRSVLRWFAMALGMVPFISNEWASWHDTLDIHSLLRPWARIFFDVSGPYATYPKVTATGRISAEIPEKEASRATACVVTSFQSDVASTFLLPQAVPNRIVTCLSPEDWVVSMKVDLDEPLLITQI